MRRRRNGFTIIEMLVAMSLVILIMSILTSAFQVGLETFSKLKAIGDMSDRLRAAVHQIRGDLRNDHFEGSIRLSDPTIITQRPREGFFFIKQFGQSTLEGVSHGSIGCYRAPRAPGGGHILYMTVKLRGNRKENFFGASVPTATSPLLTTSTTFFNQSADARLQDAGATMYTSQWAEVAYFLQPLKNSAGQQVLANNSTPLYSLHRFVRVLIADNRAVNNGLVPSTQIFLTGYSGFSWTIPAGTANLAFNTPLDVNDPAKRSFQFAQDPSDPNTPTIADVSTLLLSDVISFDVQVLAAPALPPTPPATLPQAGFPLSTTLDFSDVGGAFPATYDTKTANAGLLAVQITLRVWDLRSQQTRQITLIQDM